MTISPTVKSRFRLAGIVLLFIASMLAAFVIGAANRYRHHIDLIDTELTATQAIVWFNHLQTFRELESDLSAGCSDVALEKTHIAIDDELSWLSWFRSEHAISPIYEYIEKRDAKLLGQLENFVSQYPESAPVPVCGNRTGGVQAEKGRKAGEPAKSSGTNGRHSVKQPGMSTASATGRLMERLP